MSPMSSLPLPAPLPGVIDSHCHLHPKYGKKGQPDAVEVLARGRQAGIVGFVVVGVGETPAEARHAVQIANAHPDVVAAVGVHPHDAKDATEETIAEIGALAKDPRVAAVGEIGLDFHYDHS